MRYCGHFLIKAEGGAKNYKRDHPLPLSWTLYRRFLVAKGLHYLCQPNTYVNPTPMSLLVNLVSSSDGNDIGVGLT